MPALLAGAACFFLPLVHDLADLRGRVGLARFIQAAAALLWAGVVTVLILDPRSLALPVPLRGAAAVLAAGFLVLLVISLLVEVSVPARPEAAGRNRARRLVTTGTYALVRHPGVIWYFFFHSLAAVACDSTLLLLAAPAWTAANLAGAAVQDSVLFPRIFGAAYERYRQNVPFIVPSVASARRCLSTLRLHQAPIDEC